MSGTWQEIVHGRSSGCELPGEKYYTMTHSSGLPVFVYPKQGYSTHAIFAARYGSIDNTFDSGSGVITNVPAGIAHYLEHKLFENEDGDAFARYAKTGASANAYTGFDKTAYLFTCTGDPVPSLEILLDFVTSPYFTDKGVEKERGIIEQEIRMGLDSPSRRVLMDLLDAMYINHPVRLDIAGSIESISQITAEKLDECYNTFYNLKNMVLVVAGNITTNAVEQLADRILTTSKGTVVRRVAVDEPVQVRVARVEKQMPVSAPMFYMGYKEKISGTGHCAPSRMMSAEVLTELIAGRSSPLYSRLMSQGLINSSFDADYFSGPGYACWLFGGESSDPDAVCNAISREISRIRNDGVFDEDFKMARSAVYGRQIASLTSAERYATMLLNDYFGERDPFALIDAASELSLDSVIRLLNEGFLEEQLAVSIIKPL